MITYICYNVYYCFTGQAVPHSNPTLVPDSPCGDVAVCPADTSTDQCYRHRPLLLTDPLCYLETSMDTFSDLSV